jgi:hypothetical protein
MECREGLEEGLMEVLVEVVEPNILRLRIVSPKMPSPPNVPPSAY